MTATNTGRRAPDLDTFEHHWQDEADAAFLYRILAKAEEDATKSDVYLRLADVEDRHLEIWGKLLTEGGRPPKRFKPERPRAALRPARQMVRTQAAASDAARGGGTRGARVSHHASRHARGRRRDAARRCCSRASPPSTRARSARSPGKGIEPWHRTESGGFLRNVVYGFNDGLTANFGLVAGMIGASAVAAHQTIVLAGVAGLIADALSMGSSGYLAAKSEQEVYQNEISMERTEIELMPEVERDELALIYEAKGMHRDAAHALATEVMADPQRMLEEQVQEELKIGDAHTSPMREAWLTGLATAVGALIPVFPFFFLTGTAAMITSFALAMASHFLVGAARSIFTGRGVFRSGLDMFIVGLGVAVVGYYVGQWVASLL